MGVREPPTRKHPNFATARALRTIEVLAFEPMSTARLAATIGLTVRTARRVLRTLEHEQYLQGGRPADGNGYVYTPTPRLLALAGQLAARLPFVAGGQEAVQCLHRRTDCDAYLVIPSFGDVLVLASAGRGAPPPWSLLPAAGCAGGRVLLAHRDSWRDTQRPTDEPRRAQESELRPNEIRRRGHAIHRDGTGTSIAVPVPTSPQPLAALALRTHVALTGRELEGPRLAVLKRSASKLGRRL
jgi:DNA-binding IclR family transcriptional regulator